MLCVSSPAITSADELTAKNKTAKKLTISVTSSGHQDIINKASGRTFTVEIVSEDKEIRKGLSGRERMEDDQAMLFAFENMEFRLFWMKGMKFSLDMLFFDKDKKLIRIIENLQPCEECSLYETDENASYLLEINAGLAKKLGLSIGDIFALTD